LRRLFRPEAKRAPSCAVVDLETAVRFNGIKVAQRICSVKDIAGSITDTDNKITGHIQEPVGVDSMMLDAFFFT